MTTAEAAVAAVEAQAEKYAAALERVADAMLVLAKAAKAVRS
jgi:hypothetical protein